MRIPSKQNVNIQIAEQKRQQILEGVGIARKVDVLRGSLLRLEQTQKDFIEQSTRELTEATSQLYHKKQSLEGEIKTLEERRKKLKEPLDLEWQNLNEEKTVLENNQNIILKGIKELEIRELDIKNQEKKLKEKLARILILEKETEDNLENSKKERKQAKDILLDAKANRDEIEKEVSDRLVAVSKKENEVEFEHQGVLQIRKLNEMRKLELDEREIQLKDREETLKRNISRLNKK